jgi:hypothetical protein
MGKLADIIGPAVLHQLTDDTVVGIDIGSRGAKAGLLSKGNCDTVLGATRVNMQETAQELLSEHFRAWGCGSCGHRSTFVPCSFGMPPKISKTLGEDPTGRAA